MPLPSTLTPIATNTLASTTSNITFSNLPQGYTDLVVIADGKTTGTGWVGLVIQLNADTGSNYSTTYLYGDGSSAGSGRESNVAYSNSGAISNSKQSPNIFHFLNYSNTSTYKTFLTRASLTDGWVKAAVGLWRSTAAITSIKIYHPTDSLASGTIITIYGVKAA
jgi:hypothetical protein